METIYLISINNTNIICCEKRLLWFSNKYKIKTINENIRAEMKNCKNCKLECLK